MADPIVSVVVPARNEERLLPAALRSIEAQWLDPALVEAVVVSNGSTDATVAVVDREAARIHAAGGPRVTVLDDAAPGIARAKNVGRRHARGRLLVFMDADSRMSPGLLSRVHARAEGRRARGEHPGHRRRRRPGRPCLLLGDRAGQATGADPGEHVLVRARPV